MSGDDDRDGEHEKLLDAENRRTAPSRRRFLVLVLALASVALVAIFLTGSTADIAPLPRTPHRAQSCSESPDIPLGIETELRMTGKVVATQGTEVAIGTSCDVKLPFSTNGDYGKSHDASLHCGASTWPLADGTAGHIGHSDAGVAVTARADEVGGQLAFEVDTQAGELLVLSKRGAPFAIGLALERSSVVSTAQLDRVREAWPFAAPTHEARWSEERATKGCYYLSGPRGEEWFLGQRATLEALRVHFSGGVMLARERRGDAFVRTFTTADAPESSGNRLVVHETLRLAEAGDAGPSDGSVQGDYAYEECDGPKCGACPFHARVSFVSLEGVIDESRSGRHPSESPRPDRSSSP